MATSGRPIRFGIQTGQEYTTWEEVLALWREAEQLGYDTAWNFDHFIPIFGDPAGPCLEGWTMLAGLAMGTERIRIGCLVTGNTYRNPALLANMAATVDIISGGRLEFGIGAAWFELEHKAYSFPFPGIGTRTRMLDEACQVFKALWQEKAPNFAGEFYTLEDAYCEPKPLQRPHPPIMIGASGEKLMLRIVAKHADAWNTFASPELFKHKSEVLDRHCEEVGRDPADIERSLAVIPCVTEDESRVARLVKMLAQRRGLSEEEARRWTLSGPPEAVCKQVQKFLDVGATHIILILPAPYDVESVRRFGEEVIPSFR